MLFDEKYTYPHYPQKMTVDKLWTNKIGKEYFELNIYEIWSKTDETLKMLFSDAVYSVWIKTIIPVKIDENRFYLEVPTEINKEQMVKYENNIRDAIYEASGKRFEVVFVVRNKYNAQTMRPIVDRAAEEPVFNHGLMEKYNFENFIVGESNKFAYSASKAVAESPGGDDVYNPLFLYGGVGLGKTHLMNAIGNEIYNKNPNFKILYLSCEKFTNELISAIHDKTTDKFKEKYRNIDLLLIDDIQFISNKTQTQEEFFHTFNELKGNNKQIVISSDRPPAEIENLTARLTSRLAGGLIADIGFPDVETRTAILKEKAIERGVDIPEEILMYIADKCNTNIRELEGILTRVIAMSKLSNIPYSFEMVEDIIKNTKNNGKPNISVDYIQQVVANYYNVTVEELKSKRKTQPLATYRQIAMYFCRKLLANETLVSIGKKFGGKDHSTISNGCDRITDKMNDDVTFRQTMVEIENKIVG